MSSIAQTPEEIRNIIRRQTDREIRIIAVTKARTPEQVLKAIEAGITDIGENRLQEAQTKIDQLPKEIIKHFIGHLQTNKVREVVALFNMIQSVDSLKLAQKIDAECEKVGKIMPVLIEVNTSNEPQKSGVALTEATVLIRTISQLAHVRVEGLMTVAVHSEDEERVRSCFRALKNLFDEIATKSIPNVEMKWLSMAMSEDYTIAIEEGANMVRIGRGIFE